MGKCLSTANQEKHKSLKEKFDNQRRSNIEKQKSLKKMNTTGGMNREHKQSIRLTRQLSRSNFKMKDFINKNPNNLVDEYR